MVWFIIVLMHVANCPGKCADVPAITIQMPDEATCKAVKELNKNDQSLKCWAQPKEGG